MRGGILIIGSLLWDAKDAKRDTWRKSRLMLDQKVSVKVPIRYGRRSQGWGCCFTMTFATDAPLGHGVLVPCSHPIADVGVLLSEAQKLWKAEDHYAESGSITARTGWGCVGLLFRDQPASVRWLRDWADVFHKKVASPISPVDKEGLLRIPWPALAVDDSAVDLDVVLATATRADEPPASADNIADAWIGQDQRYERYFFKNVQHGIRTPEDGAIWRRMQEKQPSWLGEGTYVGAVSVLRGEQSGV